MTWSYAKFNEFPIRCFNFLLHFISFRVLYLFDSISHITIFNFIACYQLRMSTLLINEYECVKLRLSLLSNPDLNLIHFLLLSVNYSTYLFRHSLCSHVTAL